MSYKIIFGIFFCIIALSSCKLSADEIDTLIKKLPDQNYIKPDDRPEVKRSIAKRVIEGGNYYDYREETASYTKLFNDQSIINADYSLIYPGSLVTENSVKQSNLAASHLTTNPMTIALNISHDTTAYEKNVDCNSSAQVGNAMNKILQRAKTGYRTNFYSKCVITNTFEDAMFQLNLNADWISGSLKSEFTSNNSKSSENVYFLLKDEYYQASCEPPHVPSDLFKDRLHKSDAQYFDSANQPLIVQSVTYGRMILLKSSISTQTLKTTFSASIEQDFGYASGDVNLLIGNLSKYGITDFEVLAYGGYKDINVGDRGSIDYLKNLVSQGNTPSQKSPGVPISFRLKTLKGDNYSVRSVVNDYVRSQWNVVPELEIEVRVNSISRLTLPNVHSGHLIGRFIVNGNEITPRFSNNINFTDYNNPLNLNATPTVNFAADNITYIRIPLNEKGVLNFTVSMTENPIGNNVDASASVDQPAGGTISLNIMELLKRDQNIISENVVSKGIQAINQYQINFDVILDPKSQFTSLYNQSLASFKSK